VQAGQFLDGRLLCCLSGRVDLCGVCDGNGQSCPKLLTVTVTVNETYFSPNQDWNTDGAAVVGARVIKMLQSQALPDFNGDDIKLKSVQLSLGAEGLLRGDAAVTSCLCTSRLAYLRHMFAMTHIECCQ
jgi:hypothetical protein